MNALRYKVVARDVMGAHQGDLQRLGKLSGLDLTYEVKAQSRQEAISLAQHQLTQIEGHSHHFEIVEVEGDEPLPEDSRCVLQLVDCPPARIPARMAPPTPGDC